MATATLARLNELRVAKGMTELKSWKASQAKLEEAVKKLTPDNDFEEATEEELAAQKTRQEVQAEKTDDEKSFEELARDKMPEVLDENNDGPDPDAEPEKKPEPTFEKVKNAKKPEPEIVKHPAKLARGTDTESHCKRAVEVAKNKLKKAEAEKRKAEKPTVEEKKKAKKAAEKETAAKSKPAKPSGDTFTLADLARDTGSNPKVLRAKARRHMKEIEKLRGKLEGWNFPRSAYNEVKKLLIS